MTEFCALRAKTYAYKLDDDTELKKAKGTKKSVIKKELIFEDYKDSLLNDKIILRSQQRFRSDHHRVYTEEVNKIALSSNDDKRIQTYDKITTYPYGTNIFKICENEMLLKNKFNEGLNNNSHEAHVSKNNSQVSKNNSQALRNKSQVPIDESQALINESRILRNNLQVNRDKFHEAHVIQISSQVIRN